MRPSLEDEGSISTFIVNWHDFNVERYLEITNFNVREFDEYFTMILLGCTWVILVIGTIPW